MKVLIQLLLLPVLLPAYPPAMATGTSSTKVVITVLDESGVPIGGAFVEASRNAPGNATGRTDDKGQLVLELTREASLHMHVSRDGYYTTGGELWTGGMYKDSNGKLVARVLPEAFTVTLKKVIDPVDLIRVQYRGHLPNPGKPVGFDMERGDWVEPHGRGQVSDLLFYLNSPQAGAASRYPSLDIVFPNNGDGIQLFMAARPFSMEFGSNLAPPHTAPLDGYRPVLSLEYGAPTTRMQNDKRINYIVRTRSRADAAGVIRQACYGWIEGEIMFDPRNPQAVQVVFTSYFNPDPDPQKRSLEYLRFVPGNR